jgi:hypothetical protein
MWIKEPNFPLGKLFNDKLNFVFKQENIYLMDNHLAASCCWMDYISM